MATICNQYPRTKLNEAESLSDALAMLGRFYAAMDGLLTDEFTARNDIGWQHRNVMLKAYRAVCEAGSNITEYTSDDPRFAVQKSYFNDAAACLLCLYPQACNWLEALAETFNTSLDYVCNAATVKGKAA